MTEEKSNGLSPKKKFVLALTISTFFIFLLLFLSFAILREVKIDKLSEKDYQYILSTIGERNWKVSKSSKDKLVEYVSSDITGEMKTKRKDNLLILTIKGQTDYNYVFSFHNGYILSLFSSFICYLTYSESNTKSGRAITLNINQDKIVFNEYY